MIHCGREMAPVVIDGSLNRLYCVACGHIAMPDGSPEEKAKTAYNKYRVSDPEERTVDGITFDSKKEMARWRELSIMERSGVIHSLARQQTFSLVANGKVIERYIADFVYFEPGRGWRVEDAKGYRTSDYNRKKKWMESQFGIIIQEV